MKVLMTAIRGTLSFLLICYLLPVAHGQKEFLNQIEEWNYREGGISVLVSSDSKDKWLELQTISFQCPAKQSVPCFPETDKVNIQGIKSITRVLETWGNSIFWQLKYTLLGHPNALLPELSSLQPVSEAVDNLLKQVHSIKKRLVELNERLNAMSRILFPIRYKALRSRRPSSIHWRRQPVRRDRMYAPRHVPVK